MMPREPALRFGHNSTPNSSSLSNRKPTVTEHPPACFGQDVSAGVPYSDQREPRARKAQRSRVLIGQAGVASIAAGGGPVVLALVGGPAKDQPVPTVVRCRERRQDVAPG